MTGVSQSTSPVSWCRYEYNVEDPKTIVVVPDAQALPAPSLRCGALTDSHRSVITSPWLTSPAVVTIQCAVSVSQNRVEYQESQPRDRHDQVRDTPLHAWWQSFAYLRRVYVLPRSGLMHRAVSVEGPTDKEKQLEHFTAMCPPKGQTWPFGLQDTIKAKKLKVLVLGVSSPARHIPACPSTS